MVAEGCTPADAAMLRKANHSLIDENASLSAEVLRLQRTIAALIAIGAITEERAAQAYEIAGGF